MPSREKLSEYVAWCARNITGDEKGKTVMPPGIPRHYPDAQKLVTEDSIRPQPPEEA
jgi:hypothetical protein